MGVARINLQELANGCIQQEIEINYRDPYDKLKNRTTVCCGAIVRACDLM